MQKLKNACSSRYWTQLYRTISVQVAWFKVKKIGLCSSTPFLQDETVTMPKYALVTAHLLLSPRSTLGPAPPSPPPFQSLLNMYSLPFGTGGLSNPLSTIKVRICCWIELGYQARRN